jgi:hypothetical protein
VAVDGADSVFLTGISTSSINFGGVPTPTQGENAFVAKFTKTGAHVWSNDLPFSHGLSIAVDPAGAAVVAGYFTQQFDLGPGVAINYGGGHDAFVAKWDSAGARQWVRPYGDGSSQRAFSVATGPGDAILVAGEFQGVLDIDPGQATTWLTSDNGSRDGFVLKLDADGDLDWSQKIGDTGNASARAVAVDALGDVVVVGAFDGFFTFGGPQVQANSEDVFVAKLRGTDGSVLWSKTFSAPDTQDFRAVAIGEANTIHVTGHYLTAPDFGGGPLPTPPDNKEDLLVLVLDSAGGHLFSAGYGANNHNRGVDIALAGCSVLVSGTFHDDFTFSDGIEVPGRAAGSETFLARYFVPLTMP